MIVKTYLYVTNNCTAQGIEGIPVTAMNNIEIFMCIKTHNQYLNSVLICQQYRTEFI